jgi:hypothetical protein
MSPETRAGLPLPTDAELAILQVLWRDGPQTVREVLEHLRKDRKVGYTTVLKLLQIRRSPRRARRPGWSPS